MPYNRVAVLLSTYNGEKFLEEQLDSILSQRDVCVDLFVRDDGSCDNTLAIIQAYDFNHENVHVCLSGNIGVVSSFFSLIKTTENKYDFYALGDQDDFWCPYKLKNAISSFDASNSSHGTLYCSGFTNVDENLSYISNFVSKSNFSLPELVVENNSPGCTYVFDREFMSLLKSYELLDLAGEVYMHDWFMVILASIKSNIIYDKKSYLKYRQHGGNVIGASNGLKAFFGKVTRVMDNKSRKKVISQVIAVKSILSNVDDKFAYDLLDNFNKKTSIFGRWVYLRRFGVRRSNTLDNCFFRALFILGFYSGDGNE